MSALTLQQVLRQATQQLTHLSDAEPRFDAEVLLCYLLQKNRSHLIAWPDKVLSDTQIKAYTALINRRATGEPIAYITGQREFWSLELQVTPATLIPRPETEILVEQALVHIPKEAQWQVADLGTGSGAIALAIASERPRCQLYAIDISAEALAVAKQNAKRLNIHNINFLHSHWLDAFSAKSLNMVLSNPPYIETSDPHLCQGDVRFEPAGALSSGVDGLDDIRILIASAAQTLRPNGWLMMEHGYNQAKVVMDLLQQQGYCNVVDYVDYAGNDRVAAGQLWG